MRPVFTGRENDRLTRGRKRPGREEKREMEKRGNFFQTGSQGTAYSTGYFFEVGEGKREWYKFIRRIR